MKFFEKIGFFAVVGGNILFDSEKNKNENLNKKYLLIIKDEFCKLE